VKRLWLNSIIKDAIWYDQDEPNEWRKKNDQMNEVQWEKSRVGGKTGKTQEVTE